MGADACPRGSALMCASDGLPWPRRDNPRPVGLPRRLCPTIPPTTMARGAGGPGERCVGETCRTQPQAHRDQLHDGAEVLRDVLGLACRQQDASGSTTCHATCQACSSVGAAVLWLQAPREVIMRHDRLQKGSSAARGAGGRPAWPRVLTGSEGGSEGHKGQEGEGGELGHVCESLRCPKRQARKCNKQV